LKHYYLSKLLVFNKKKGGITSGGATLYF